MVRQNTRPSSLLLPIKNNNMLHSDHNTSPSSTTSSDGDDSGDRRSRPSANPHRRFSPDASPILMSPWNRTSTPSFTTPPNATHMGSLLRHDGHVYSLAAKAGLLYTGSDSKNIRVWKNMEEFDAFKSSSGFVKAIVISGDRVFTGHHDGRIRVWRRDIGGRSHKQIGTLPAFFDVIKASIRPKNYVEVKPKTFKLWLKHADAISCLSMDEESNLLYSSSWDRTFKAWRISDSKCIDSVHAHDDAVNAVAAGGGGLVYTGSADGAVKVWKREQHGGKAARHFLRQTLLALDCAVTALAVCAAGAAVYCGSSDGAVNFWEVGKEISHGGALKGHGLAVLCLAAAGNLVLSGSADKTICVWRREGAAHTWLTVMMGHAGPVKCLAVEEEDGGGGRWRVYSGSIDRSVKVWSVSETASDLVQVN